MNDIARLRYENRKKDNFTAYLCWVILGCHYAYFGRWGLQLLYWFTAGGCGIWALIDLFRIPRLVEDYNDDLLRRFEVGERLEL